MTIWSFIIHSDSKVCIYKYLYFSSFIAIPVAYGLYLVFFAWLAPNSIPSSIPFGDFVKTFGKNNHDVVAGFSIFAIIAHSMEALYAIYLSRNRYKIKPYKVFLWFLNGLLFGIFALWPLIFPKMYFKIRNWINELFSKCKNPDTSIDVTPNSWYCSGLVHKFYMNMRSESHDGIFL